jgi:hypothetical protein
MIVSIQDKQDTIKPDNVTSKDTLRIQKDSVQSLVIPHKSAGINSKDTRVSQVAITSAQASADTTMVCKRNSIADITYYDSTSFINQIVVPGGDRTIILLAEKSSSQQAEKKEVLIKHLKTGQNIPENSFHNDWVILIIVIVAFLFSLIRANSGNSHPLSRFFLFRGINDPGSRDTVGLFHWQSSILNLISFFIISLFSYYIAAFYNLIPQDFPGLAFWSVSLIAIVILFTLRNAVCAITGNMSGQKEVFNEYLVAIYQFYHFSALFLLVLIIFVSYTLIFPAKVFLVIGIVTIGIMYLIRVTRLLIIFINRNISIFYLILYLCALEILPVAIAIRYFTGPV